MENRLLLLTSRFAVAAIEAILMSLMKKTKSDEFRINYHKVSELSFGGCTDFSWCSLEFNKLLHKLQVLCSR